MISHFDLSVISPNGPTFPVQHPTKHGELKASLKHDYDSNVRFLKIGVAYVAQKYFKVLVERCSAVGMGWDGIHSRVLTSTRYTACACLEKFRLPRRSAVNHW